MRIAFLGFGLIAGAVAQAVRSNPVSADWPIAAWSPSGDGPRTARDNRVVDVVGAAPPAVIAGTDLLVLAGPVTACLSWLDDLAGQWAGSLAPDTVVTDVASTKTALVVRADGLGLKFVGGHPMAGLETSGYRPGTADLFVDRPWVIVPGRFAGPGDIDRVVALAAACRASPLTLEAAAHDRAVAGISHLPLVMAAAMVEAVAGEVPGADRPDPDRTVALRLAAGAWRDATRVARGDPDMGAAIATTNAVELAARIRALRSVLDAWLADLDGVDGADEMAIRARLASARSILDGDR